MSKVVEFEERLARHLEELKWLYCELYPEDGFSYLCSRLKARYEERRASLKKLDRTREEDPDWYKRNDMAGMMMYTEAFAGNLKGVKERLPYIRECGVNYLHLMPLLDSPEGRSDGGYAVSDFGKVRPDLGTMKDLAALTETCHKKGLSVCLDFVMNHTSEEHEWAKRARAGEKEFQDRYFFFDTFDIPGQYEKTCPQVFPTTAPGNFTWLEEEKKFVMTTFYPYQWDLNYRNPMVFHDMTDCLLNLTNQGVDIIRIDAVPYIWKELGTTCRNLPQVHSIVRMLRMICEIVCPGVLLLGEVVMEPVKVVPYFGTVEKPECHMLYNVTTMATTWHTAATGDVALLKRQMDIVNALPKEYVFLNYLRCHDDIGWGLDYDWLKAVKDMEEVPHKKYLNDYFTGKWPGSYAKGELYNDDPTSGDARLCGTTASLCGLERALEEENEEAAARSVRFIEMLHGYMLVQSGIPVIYSGDEIGQLNDNGYHNDPRKAEDSRYLHRGSFSWEKAELRKTEGSYQKEIFDCIRKMEDLRAVHPVFLNQAAVWTADTYDAAILCVNRAYGEEKLTALFNFAGEERTAWINEEGMYVDLICGERMEGREVKLPAYGMRWLLRE
ncbi:alpha-amylase family protein [Candidatus Merdisoma sp. JLR.KK011]|uniref:alpha-amylase family protein n=1 Tax=Candidatus Merdisoma sp. JLR.KK011 TaxID=3114299 RepID=UPI002FF29A59